MVPAHVACSGIALLQAARTSKASRSNVPHSPARRGEYVIALVCRPELDRFPMWCTPIRLRPCLFACGERLSLSQALRLNQPFESSQPMLVIARAIVGLAAVGRRFDFISQRFRPFFPREHS